MNTEMNVTAPGVEPGVEVGSHPAEWRVWSDGACVPNPGPAGWGVLVETPCGESWTLHGNSRKSTNNRAEMYGFLQGVLAVPLETPAVIRTDSTYVRDGTTRWRRGWQARDMRTKDGPVKNADLWPLIWEAIDARPLVRIEWVRGHSGERGNEIVDKIATAAAERRAAGGRPEDGVRTALAP